MTFDLDCALDLEGIRLPVFPLLMPSTWEAAPTQLCRPLVSGVSVPGMPVVALVHLVPMPDSPTPNRVFLRSERAASIGKTVGDFERAALRNIAACPRSWTWGDVGSGRVGLLQGTYLAAEHILDPAFLLEAHREVDDDQLLVGIPARGSIYVTGMKMAVADGVHLQAFGTLIEEQFRTGIAIAPCVFMVKQGRVHGVLEWDA